MRKENLKSIEPTRQAEEDWYKTCKDLNDGTLFPMTKSWYMGTNIPGKKKEQLNYIGGLPLYEKTCLETLDGWKGFTTVKA